MGYFSVPKIGDVLPSELGELHDYKDLSAKDPIHHVQSNFWALRAHVEMLGFVYEDIIPYYPEMIRYAVPWLLCFYGLDCLNRAEHLPTERPPGNAEPLAINEFKRFIGESFGRWLPDDWSAAGVVLIKKEWIDTENPIFYLRTVLKKRKNEGRYLDGSIFGGGILEIDEPIVSEEFMSFGPSGELFRNRAIENIEVQSTLMGALKEAGFRPEHIDIHADHLFLGTTLSDVAEYRGLSEKQYDALRKERQRKKYKLQEILKRTFN